MTYRLNVPEYLRLLRLLRDESLEETLDPLRQCIFLLKEAALARELASNSRVQPSDFSDLSITVLILEAFTFEAEDLRTLIRRDAWIYDGESRVEFSVVLHNYVPEFLQSRFVVTRTKRTRVAAGSLQQQLTQTKRARVAAECIRHSRRELE